jgi:hypothetical protein
VRLLEGDSQVRALDQFRVRLLEGDSQVSTLQHSALANRPQQLPASKSQVDLLPSCEGVESSFTPFESQTMNYFYYGFSPPPVSHTYIVSRTTRFV